MLNDPLISRSGRVYSKRGLLTLATALMRKNGRVVDDASHKRNRKPEPDTEVK